MRLHRLETLETDPEMRKVLAKHRRRFEAVARMKTKLGGKTAKEATLLNDPNKLSAGSAFDEQTYTRAIPFFKAGVQHFAEAGPDIADMVRSLVRYLASEAKMSWQAIEAMRPYVRRFIEDVQSGDVRLGEDSPEPPLVVEDEKHTDDDEKIAPRFPLSQANLALLQDIAEPVRERLRTADPAFIRTAAVVLLALERLPRVTFGASIRVGWRTVDEWADVSVSEEEIRASVGTHSYEHGVGGDTASETLFSSCVSGRSYGHLKEWVERAWSVAQSGRLTVYDEWAGEDHIDWLETD